MVKKSIISTKNDEFKKYLIEIKDYYQEKIEEETNIKLGNLEVGLINELQRDIM